MTALNVFLENYFPEKTFTIVSLCASGLVTLILFSYHSKEIEYQYEEAQVVPNRRYTLIKIMAHYSQSDLVIEGALMSFFDEKEVKHILFFKNVNFSSDVDFSNMAETNPYGLFLCVEENGEILLKPRANCEIRKEA